MKKLFIILIIMLSIISLNAQNNEPNAYQFVYPYRGATNSTTNWEFSTVNVDANSQNANIFTIGWW